VPPARPPRQPDEGWQLRLVQPYQAVKEYRCPGCDHEIRQRTLHVVVWPDGSPEQRRHWHRSCWDRRPGGG
jgi:hypothetical protein